MKINHLDRIIKKLGVNTLDEAIELINKDPEKNITKEQLIEMQEKIDRLYDTIMTNQNAFGVQIDQD